MLLHIWSMIQQQSNHISTFDILVHYLYIQCHNHIVIGACVPSADVITATIAIKSRWKMFIIGISIPNIMLKIKIADQ